MDVGHHVRGQLPQGVPVLGDETFQAVGNAHNGRHIVGVVGLHDDGADHVVDAGAQAAAGDDGALGAGRVEIELFAWSCRLETDAAGLSVVFAQFLVHKNLNTFVVGPGAVGQMRFQLAGP